MPNGMNIAATGVNAFSSFLSGYLEQKEKVDEKAKEAKRVENAQKTLNDLMSQGYQATYDIDTITGKKVVRLVSPQVAKQKKQQQELENQRKRQIIQQAQEPEGYRARLKQALQAIQQGGDSYKVYQMIAGMFPTKSAELKRILVPSTKLGEVDIFDQLINK